MSWLGKIQLPKSQRIYKMSKEQNWFHQKPKECCLPPDMSIAATQNSRPRPCNSQHIRRLQLDLSMAQLCPAVLANLDRPTAALQVASCASSVLQGCSRALICQAWRQKPPSVRIRPILKPKRCPATGRRNKDRARPRDGTGSRSPSARTRRTWSVPFELHQRAPTERRLSGRGARRPYHWH